jgi:hypothetical protein
MTASLERRYGPYQMVNPYRVKEHSEADQLSRSRNSARDACSIGNLLRTGRFINTHCCTATPLNGSSTSSYAIAFKATTDTRNP